MIVLYKVTKVSLETNVSVCLMKPIVIEIFLQIASLWSFKDSLSSTMTPRLFSSLNSINFLMINCYNRRSSILDNWYLEPMIMYSHFLTFKVSLFATSQRWIRSWSSFSSVSTSTYDCPSTVKWGIIGEHFWCGCRQTIRKIVDI